MTATSNLGGSNGPLVTPGGGNGAGSVSAYGETAATGNNTRSLTTYATLVSLNLNVPAGGAAKIDATAAGQQSTIATVFFRISRNGTVWRSSAETEGLSGFGNHAITGIVAVGASGLVAGANTINLDWRVDAGTATINLALDGHHAVLSGLALT